MTLEEIKKTFRKRPEHVEWLIAEVERLREEADVTFVNKAHGAIVRAEKAETELASYKNDCTAIHEKDSLDIRKLEIEREKLIGALEKIFKLLQVHPEQIRKAAWRYKIYEIVTAILAEVKEQG